MLPTISATKKIVPSRLAESASLPQPSKYRNDATDVQTRAFTSGILLVPWGFVKIRWTNKEVVRGKLISRPETVCRLLYLPNIIAKRRLRRSLAAFRGPCLVNARLRLHTRP